MDRLHEHDSVLDQAQRAQDYSLPHLNSAQYYDHLYDM